MGAPPKSLGSSAARGAATTMAGQIGRIILQFGGIIVLARLLDPEDYGLLAMVLAVVGIGDVIRDFGLSSAAIQAPEVTRQQRSNLWWINFSLGTILSVVALLSAPLIARGFDQPELAAITAALAVTFILNGASTQFRADLYRSLRFSRVVVVDLASQTIALIAAVAAAQQGLGYWALVVQQVVQPLLALVLVVSMNPWLPHRFRRGAGTRKFMRYGWNLLATQMIGYASRNIDSLIIGSRFGPAQLGVYNRAFQLLMMPLNQINVPATRVALPILSRLQSDKEKFDAFILRGQAILLHVVVAVFAVIASQAGALIEIVLGSTWSGVAPILQVLIIGGVFQAAGYASYWVFLAKGLTGANLRYSLVTRSLLIVAILVGANWGVFGVAWAYSVGLVLMWPAGLLWLGRISDAPVRGMFLNGVRVIAGYVPSAIAAYLAASWAESTSLMLSLVAGIATGLTVFGVVLVLWPAFRADIRAVLETRRLLRKVTQ